MTTYTLPGTSGLTMNESLLWERSQKGRCGFSLPRRDVPETDLPAELKAPVLDLPDLSELDVVRHYTRLSQWNFGVDTGSYPLGSCTMKYNPKTNEVQAARAGFAQAHPLLPAQMAQGLLQLLFDLQACLAEITGLPFVTLQPAAGAHGEYAGMRIFYAHDQSQGRQRRKVLIPDTAHGTNPASAAMCGYQTIPVKSTSQGILSAQAVFDLMDEDTAGIMVTNPNTLGLFEENIREIARVVHDKGGLVYCDGANFNALMGIVDMAQAGVDVLHLNLHKTFAAPHGGGGPGSGPVCVTSELEPYLPIPRVVKGDKGYALSEDFPQSIGRLHTFHGNVGVMIKAASYILSLGPELKKVSQLAVLNANYIKEQLKDSFYLPYDRTCMHECVFSDAWQEKNKVSTLDIAKRLIDFGFHPPTIFFPLVVSGSMMVEPTETEGKEDLDRFVQAMRTIAKEADENPQILHDAPSRTKVGRMDETLAARHPCLTG
ncbi:MAG: aminomethyl-transferring glycine dehydrogenase subunit GcvPB [Thermodesulfobacteriota bacterium]